MNIQKAKKIIGPTAEAQDWHRLYRAEIKLARAQGENTPREIELNQAAAFLKKRTRANICEVCGQRIARAATRCGLCSRQARQQNAISFPEQPQPAKKNRNARVDVSPRLGPWARTGYFLKPIRKVAQKWTPTLGAEIVLQCFNRAASAIQDRGQTNMLMIPRERWPAVLEFAVAFSSIYLDNQKPEAWFLRLPLCVADGTTGFKTWREIRDEIRSKGGPSFSLGELATSAYRMGITTAPKVADDWRKHHWPHFRTAPPVITKSG